MTGDHATPMSGAPVDATVPVGCFAMNEIYICIVPIKDSPPVYEKREELASMGYETSPTPVASSWCKKVATVEEAKRIIREINDMGFGTASFARRNSDVLVDLSDEDMILNKEIYFFKKNHGLS